VLASEGGLELILGYFGKSGLAAFRGTGSLEDEVLGFATLRYRLNRFRRWGF
jgi:hypothetical protein